ncbi:uncharacterized protein BX664DRAFT_358517 [Halteromyces radiatus]|uniref:uncharacterized protein n=1 Tax=Halteromyces radiatus TaxID=101107 RepID=UPI00221E396B|nr:uncharacterized protein BX664DRAFT_358517 [Halteromyces radiatus]KAI8088889.1 hypothetical protein BX664DRAFT_358517 [Halteromyces radiatus]
MNKSGTRFWQFDEFVGELRDMSPSTIQPVTPRKDSRIVLVETSTSTSSSSINVTTSHSTSSASTYPRVERLTLQEVNTSPTYYGAASLSYRNSLASTVSNASTVSARSNPTSYSPPSSPILDKKDQQTYTSSPVTLTPTYKRQWTTPSPARLSYTGTMYPDRPAPFPPFMIGSSQPLGWLRPSLSSSALLDINKSSISPHFVFLGFGDSHVIADLLNLTGPIPLDGDNISERSLLFKVDDEQQALCTLATIPPDGEEYPYLENLSLNRIGVTSILAAISSNSTVDDIMQLLGQINKTLKGLDPQGTWWERLILLFHHTTEDDYMDDRFHLVQRTLPDLMQHISPLPCISVFVSNINDQSAEYQQECRRILYQQACMHQTDLGWWHGSASISEDASGSSDDDDDAFLPVAVMIGNNNNTKKKPAFKKLFKIDNVESSSTPSSSSNPTDGATTAKTEQTFLFNEDYHQHSVSSPTHSVELKHRFSKKWTEPPRRHHTISRPSPLKSTSPH